MRVLAIDPGNEESGWVCYDGHKKAVSSCGINRNEQLLKALDLTRRVRPGFRPGFTPAAPSIFEEQHVLVIEKIANMGMTAGATTFDTCIWTGRFMQAWHEPDEVTLMPRNKIKLYICGTMRAKDANVRQALLDRFPATGGGKTKQIGTMKQPGPLHGMASHMWSALAVAVTAHDMMTMIIGAICPRCVGEGVVTDDPHDYYYPVPCPLCEGKKLVTREMKHAATGTPDKRPALRSRARVRL